MRVVKCIAAGVFTLAQCGAPEPRENHEANAPCELLPDVGLCHDPTPPPATRPPGPVTIVCDPPGGGFYSKCEITPVDEP